MNARKYVCVEFNELTNERLLDFCRYNNIEVKSHPDYPDDFDFHVTIIFSENESNLPNVEFRLQPFTLYPEKLDAFGEDGSCLVLRILKTKPLMDLRCTIERSGLTDKWPEYSPHCTLTYGFDDKSRLNKIMLPTFPLTVTKMKIKDIK